MDKRYEDAVSRWVDGYGSDLSPFYEEYKQRAPKLYRGVSTAYTPLNVGGVYFSTGLDSWTEDMGIAGEFADSSVQSDIDYGVSADDGSGTQPVVFHLDEGDEGISVSTGDDGYDEREWAVGGQFDIVEEIDMPSDTERRHLKLRRRAWDNPAPAKSEEEARTRFGDDFVDALRGHVDEYGESGYYRPLLDAYEQYSTPTPKLYRGIGDGANLQVGDTYKTYNDLDSWTEDPEKAKGFADAGAEYLSEDMDYDDEGYAGSAILELDSGDSGLSIANAVSGLENTRHDYTNEREWLLRGDFEVTERSEDPSGYTRLKLRRRAWNNPEPAKTDEEARQRFGDDFADSIIEWKDGYETGNDDEPFQNSTTDYSEHHRSSTDPLYRGVVLDEPLKVGDTYETRGKYDSWSEDKNVASLFALGDTLGDSDQYDIHYPYRTLLHLPEGGSGFPIDDMVPTNWNNEKEWLLDGEYEVDKDLGQTEFNGFPFVNNFRLKRKAWNNPEEPTSYQEAVSRYGQDFVDTVVKWKSEDAEYGGWNNPDVAGRMRDYHDRHKEPVKRLFRGVSLPKPLEVGDTYSSTGFDSWTENEDLAIDFIGRYPHAEQTPGSMYDTGAILTLNPGETEGLDIDRFGIDAGSYDELSAAHYLDEHEWILDGDFEVAGVEEPMGGLGGDDAPRKYTLRRKAWNNPEPAKTEDEARQRFGDEFVEGVHNWKYHWLSGDEPFQHSTTDYSERHIESPALYRGVRLDEPLGVGDTYETIGKYDGWTEDKDIAERFVDATKYVPGKHQTVLHLTEGGSGLPIDQMIRGNLSKEKEWLLDGNYEVVEDLGKTEVGGYPVNNLRLKRKAWNNPERARSEEESRSRFGDEFVDAVIERKNNNSSDIQDQYNKHKQPTPRLYRGVALESVPAVGDTYTSTGLDSWTEDIGTANLFARDNALPNRNPVSVVFRLDKDDEGLWVDRAWVNEHSDEREWLLGGDFEVTEDLGNLWSDIRHMKVRRKASKVAAPFTEMTDRDGSESLDLFIFEGNDPDTLSYSKTLMWHPDSRDISPEDAYGFIKYTENYPENYTIDTTEVRNKGQGYGTMMLDEFEGMLPEYSTVSLEPYDDAAENFWSGRGYRSLEDIYPGEEYLPENTFEKSTGRSLSRAASFVDYDYHVDIFSDIYGERSVRNKVIADIGSDDTSEFVVAIGDYDKAPTEESLIEMRSLFDEHFGDEGWISTPGNHETEYIDGEPDNLRWYLDHIGWGYVDYPGENVAYRLVDSDAYVLMNSAFREYDESTLDELESVLGSLEGTRHIFVFTHTPFVDPITPDENEEDHAQYIDDSTAEQFHDIMVRYGVTAAFFSHQHSQETWVRDGVLYVITAGGGSPLDELDEEYHYIRLYVGEYARVERRPLFPTEPQKTEG